MVLLVPPPDEGECSKGLQDSTPEIINRHVNHLKIRSRVRRVIQSILYVGSFRLSSLFLKCAISPRSKEISVAANVSKRGRGGVHEAWGQTEAGRYVLVIFRYLGHNCAWPITARDMDENEKRLLRRK